MNTTREIVDVDELINHSDIVEYISQYTDLEERRDGEWWGLSPLKDENTPSFSVNPDDNVFFDFSSGVGGNILTFIMQYHKCSYPVAIKMLQEFTGIDSVGHKCKRLESTKIALRFKRKPKREKVFNHKSMTNDCMNRYEWNKGKLQVWNDEDISWESMKKFQVRYDRVANRIVLPIRDMNGSIINICGRTLDPMYKEKKLRKYTYYNSFGGGLNTLYGFHENKEDILKAREVIIFEGSKSVLKADSWGIKNTVALLTSHLSDFQLRELIKMRCRVVFALDDGIDVHADKNIQRLKHYANVEYIFDFERVLEEKDAPVDKGLDIYMKLYNERRSL